MIMSIRINLTRYIYLLKYFFVISLSIYMIFMPEKVLSQSSNSSIVVEGNIRISTDTILSISNLFNEKNYTNTALNDALVKLNASNFFKSVSINKFQNNILIKVIENPTINSINFEGNYNFNDEELLKLIYSKDRQTLQISKIEKDTEIISNAYSVKGRISAQISPKIIEISDNRVDLIFEINEGKITEIEKIAFIGNRSFSDIRLRGIIATKQAGIFRKIIKSDTFIQDRFEYDQQLLSNFYTNRGFVDFKIISASANLTRAKNAFLLNFTIKEGQRYSFGKVKFNGPESIVNDDGLYKLVNIKENNFYDSRKIDKLIDILDVEIAKKGFNFIGISPSFVRDDNNLIIDVNINFVPTKKIFVERIEIVGNSTTLDEVIRLKFDFAEGDPFNNRKIKEAADKIRSIGFFSDVKITSREGSSSDKIIINVKLKEKATGSLGIGAGYNSSDGSVLTFNLNERNFMGKGQTVDLALSTSSFEKEMTLRLEDPSYLGRNLLAGVSFGTKTSTPYSVPLSIENTHLAPKIKFPLSRDSSMSIVYRLDQDKTKLSSASVTASPLIKSDVGNKTKSGIVLSYNLDKTNSLVAPTSGFDFEFKQELNGIGGDIKYSKSKIEVKSFKSLFNDNVIISSDLSSGAIIGSDANIVNRFKLGGDKLRGFRSYGVGPVDNSFSGSDANGDPLGGKMFAAVNVQASFPIGIPEEYGVFGGVFIGAGSVWGLDQKISGSTSIDDSAKVRSAAGVSLFWDTLIGPLRFNFSRPISKEVYDVTENFRFTVDTRF